MHLKIEEGAQRYKVERDQEKKIMKEVPWMQTFLYSLAFIINYQ